MNRYVSLLKSWCDGLIEYQIKELADSTLNGAFVCPACKNTHGRCDNAMFPMMYMFNETQDEKYRTCAFGVFDWQKNVLLRDYSVYNDGNNEWRGITVFSAIGYLKTLINFKEQLGNRAAEVEKRCKSMCEWLLKNLTVNFVCNINYIAANSGAMALAWQYFGNEKYRKISEDLLNYCLEFITENGLLFGEMFPRNSVSRRGCTAVDIGYNVEESVPALLDAALILGDEEKIAKVQKLLTAQLDFMLPDGAWDNSFGCRNYKWTYWGSRTSDGAAAAYYRMKDRDPQFETAALRNIDLLERCTHDGLLYGGPDYYKWGERACVHHTFCHALGLADALVLGIKPKDNGGELPLDKPCCSIKYYPEIATYRINSGDLIADITAYDFGENSFVAGRGHATGGTMSLLFSRKYGVVAAASLSFYRTAEPLNQQLTLNLEQHAPLTFRIECSDESGIYTSALDTTAELTARKNESVITVTAQGTLTNLEGRKKTGAEYILKYTFESDCVTIDAELASADKGCVFIAPLIGDAAKITTASRDKTREIFNLVPGFIATEHSMCFENGKLSFKLSFQK